MTQILGFTISAAKSAYTSAGFTGTFSYNPATSRHGWCKTQNLVGGQTYACTADLQRPPAEHHDATLRSTVLAGRERGQALVEFALVLPILILLLVGIFDFGRAVYAFNTVNNAAREGVRLAIVDQNCNAIGQAAPAARILPERRLGVRRLALEGSRLLWQRAGSAHPVPGGRTTLATTAWGRRRTSTTAAMPVSPPAQRPGLVSVAWPR